MKIVNREQFLGMPSGTLFSKYRPCVFDELSIKGDTWSNDFVVQQIAGAVDAEDGGQFVDILERAREEGSSFWLDLDCAGRDGLFDQEQLFAVWEKRDVEQLIARLTHALTEGYGA